MELLKNEVYLKDLEITIENTINIDKLKNKKIMITGATGTIGSFIAHTLIYFNENYEAGINLYLCSRRIENLKKVYSTNDKITFVEYDMGKEITFNEKVDYIIHAAGNAFPQMFEEQPVDTIYDNIISTYNLLKYAKVKEVKRVLYVSSGEVYGKGEAAIESFKEDYCGYIDSTSSRACYPNSKRATETLCSSFSKQYNVDTVIVRPSHTYGPVMTSQDNRANVQFIKKALKKENIVLRSQGTQMRSYTYISDCVSGLLTVLINGEKAQAYNLANPLSKLTIAELAQVIARHTNTKVIYEISKNEMPGTVLIPKQVLDTQKLESLGWKGSFDIEKGITHIIKILS